MSKGLVALRSPQGALGLGRGAVDVSDVCAAGAVGNDFGMEASTNQTYEIRLGSRTIARRDAIAPQHAVLDYLRSIGCEDAEVARVSTDAASWRGALYTAVPEPAAGAAEKEDSSA